MPQPDQSDIQQAKNSFVKVPRHLLHVVGKAIADYQMINANDRILLGLSGGKDSLSLLHILLHFQRHAPISFDIGVVTEDPQSDSFDPSPLIPYLKELDIPYFYQSEPILELADKHMSNNSFCAFCSRMKRGIIYSMARRENYNVIALAQHLDDLAESFLMSAFHRVRSWICIFRGRGASAKPRDTPCDTRLTPHATSLVTHVRHPGDPPFATWVS